ncbi:hypothetical protein V501_10084 [Pseudogymnoascus sp. VKM F-4519 (FW-2642)]|nr:hypothetical protein V501_10084 [Pseudogymnoascus sp. VKM F-4519 (FW-2642)]
MDIEKTGIQKTGIETTDIEKVDIEKGEFEEPVDWATARWTKERIQSRLLSYTLALCSIAIVALIFQARYTPSDTRDQTPNPQGTIPSYAIDYAPLIWLDVNEEYFPSSLATHIQNTHPSLDHDALTLNTTLDLTNLSLLNALGDEGLNIYLTSNLDVTTLPPWLTGTKPSSTGLTSSTSAAIIAVPRSASVVDVFYTYFYSFNLGPTVLGQQLGNHVGDWEHNMIRFVDGFPEAMWFSQHGGGQAFAYSAVEKIGKRPVGYSAKGTHANYASPGRHDLLLPGTHLPFDLLLTDYSSNGTLWDPTLNAFWYTYDAITASFTGAADIGGEEGNPVGAMEFRGRWGDKQYRDGDERQSWWWGWRRWVDGPRGPWDKKLVREGVCPDGGFGGCVVKQDLREEEGRGVWVGSHAWVGRD